MINGQRGYVFTIQMFMTVATDIPSNWVATIGEGGAFDLAPAKWLRPGFWEDDFNGDSQAVTDFEEERAKILAEAETQL